MVDKGSSGQLVGTRQGGVERGSSGQVLGIRHGGELVRTMEKGTKKKNDCWRYVK